MHIRLMDKILHDPKDPKLWELWYIPYNMGNAGFCPSAVLTLSSKPQYLEARLESARESALNRKLIFSVLSSERKSKPKSVGIKGLCVVVFR